MNAKSSAEILDPRSFLLTEYVLAQFFLPDAA